MSDGLPDTWLHVYGQYCWHSEVRVVGTKEGLTALRDAIDQALAVGEGEAEVFASDGEGYAVVVSRASMLDQLGRPEYLIELENKIAHNEFRRHRKIERALSRNTLKATASETSTPPRS